MKKYIKMIIVIALCVCILVSCLCLVPRPKQTESVKFAAFLGPGWNLGNTLEAWSLPEPEDTETCWGNPKTSKKLISFIHSCGFQTVRLPITWFQHMDENGVIDEEWMDRVQEITDYVIDSGMNAIINVQHDDQDWLTTDKEHEEAVCEKLATVWEQIAERFKDYDSHLIFETMNEPRVVGIDTEWGGDEEGRRIVNRLNNVALDVIRKSGGNNSERFVFITDYAASDLPENFTALEVPDDEHIVVALHYYPGTAHRSEFEDCEKSLGIKGRVEIYRKLRSFYSQFAKKGIGVCISEFGWTDRNHLDNLAEKASFLVKTADHFGFCCFVWDNGESFELIDREKLTVSYPEYLKVITEVGE